MSTPLPPLVEPAAELTREEVRALQPPPDHSRPGAGRAEAAQERPRAGHRRRRAGFAGAAVPGGRGRGHHRHRRVRRGRRVQPAAPDHPRAVRHRPVQGRERARLHPRDQPAGGGAAARVPAGARQRRRAVRAVRPDPGRHRQLRHPLSGQRRRRAGGQAVRVGVDLPLRGSGVGVLGGRARRTSA